MCRMVPLIIEFKLVNRMEKIYRLCPLIHYGDFCRFWIDISKTSIYRNFRYIDPSLMVCKLVCRQTLGLTVLRMSHWARGNPGVPLLLIQKKSRRHTALGTGTIDSVWGGCLPRAIYVKYSWATIVSRVLCHDLVLLNCPPWPVYRIVFLWRGHLPAITCTTRSAIADCTARRVWNVKRASFLLWVGAFRAKFYANGLVPCQNVDTVR